MVEPATGSAVTTALASPLTLLMEEEQHGDRQAEDVLLLSFTADLGFLEAFVLGVAQACGARVTVVGDAWMSSPDPRAARRAGRTYLPGQATCDGAFHPKLVLITGPERVTAAIGSGNATLAGWQGNAELWTVLRGDTTSCPAMVTDLAGWLRRLPEFIRFSGGVGATLTRTAGHLDAMAAATGEVIRDGTRLVSSSAGPILQQLPRGPVRELAVCAPFHDPHAAALRALIERFAPERLLISYQPELTQLDGPAVSKLMEEIHTDLRQDGVSRYRHGKLIEWATPDERWALTGSPNLSGAALLHGLIDGGNCELGVIAPIQSTLLPEGTRVAAGVVHHEQLRIRSRSTGGPLLLGATRVEEGLHVLLGRPLTAPGYLELSPAAAPPETWERVGDVPAGVSEVTVTVAADGGSRLRLITNTSDDAARCSNLVFVVDPGRVNRRPGITTGHTPSTRPDELFEDPRLAERFFTDLLALKTGLPAVAPRTAAATANKAPDVLSTRVDDDPDGWEQYLQKCAGRLGHPLLRFALGLPAQASGGETIFQALIPASWAEDTVPEDEAGLTGDTAESTAGQGYVGPSLIMPDVSGVPKRDRRRYQRWAERMTEAAPQFGAPERMLVTRLLLWSAAARVWDRDDLAWVGLLSRALQTLATADLPPQAEPQVGSLAAVALSVLRGEAPRFIHTEETIAYEKAANAVAHLLVATDAAYVEEYSKLIDSAFGSAVDPRTVQALAADVVQNDPVDDAIRALEERGRDVHRHGERVLHVNGMFGNPTLVALEAVGAAQDAGVVGAWASSTNGGWALCMWNRPNLFTITAGTGLSWRHYRLSNRQSPRGLALQQGLQSAANLQHGPYLQPIPEAVEALNSLGLESPQPPAACAE